MAFSIAFNNTNPEVFAADLSYLRVTDVPNDTTLVEVELKENTTSIFKVSLYAYSGTITVNRLFDIVKAYMEENSKYTFSLTATASYTSSGTTTSVSCSATVYRCDLRFTNSSVGCATFLANNFLTLNKSRIIKRSEGLTLYYYAPPITPLVVHKTTIYTDGTQSTSTSSVTPGLGVNTLTVTLPTHSTKTPAEYIVSVGNRKAIFYITDDSVLTIGYTNLFGRADKLYLRASVETSLEREFEVATLEDNQTIFDLQKKSSIVMNVSALSKTETRSLNELIALGRLTYNSQEYLITDHSWKVNDLPGGSDECTLTLEPVDTDYTLDTDSASGSTRIFSDQFTDVYA